MRRTNWVAIFAGLAAGLAVGLALVWWWLRRRREDERLEGESQQGIVLPPEAPPKVASDAEARPPVTEGVAEPPSRDDLRRIHGIGPKIDRVLDEVGITTFAQLASCDASRLRGILDSAGVPLADPSSWPEQARLAAEGRWGELDALQARLKPGRRVGSQPA